MKTNHTPGPWESHNGEITTLQVPGRSYRRIAAIQDYGVSGLLEVDAANANLIAAAPELLEACNLAEATIERLNRHDSANGTLDVIRAAIAKANPST